MLQNVVRVMVHVRKVIVAPSMDGVERVVIIVARMEDVNRNFVNVSIKTIILKHPLHGNVAVVIVLVRKVTVAPSMDGVEKVNYIVKGVKDDNPNLANAGKLEKKIIYILHTYISINNLNNKIRIKKKKKKTTINLIL